LNIGFFVTHPASFRLLESNVFEVSRAPRALSTQGALRGARSEVCLTAFAARLYYRLSSGVYTLQTQRHHPNHPTDPNGGSSSVIKLDIVNRVADRTGVPKMKAEQAVDALFHSMKEALARGERIELRGFGVFVVKPRKRGVGRNPRTGEEVAIPTGKTIRFKPGKELQAHGFDTDDDGAGHDTDAPNSATSDE